MRAGGGGGERRNARGRGSQHLAAAVLMCRPGTPRPPAPPLPAARPARRAPPSAPPAGARPASPPPPCRRLPRGDHNMAAAPGLLFWLLLLGPLWRVPGQPHADTSRRFAEHKLCADEECSSEWQEGGGGGAARGRELGSPASGPGAQAGRARRRGGRAPAPRAVLSALGAPGPWPGGCASHLLPAFPFPVLIWRGLGLAVAVAPGFPRDGSKHPLPARPRGETEQLGCAPRALGSPRRSKRSPAPAAGTWVGAVGAQMRRGLGGCVPGRRLMVGLGKGAGGTPSPYCFSRIWGSYRLLTGIGVWVWDEPGVQACSVFQGLRLGCASVLSFLCLEVSLQTARQGGHLKEGQNLSLLKEAKNLCLGHLGPAASSLRRKRNCAPVLDWGWGMDCGRRGGLRSPEADEEDS